jgi:hypothetical protein
MLEAIDKMFQFNQNRRKKGFVRGELADVEFVQGRHPFVREEPFLFCTLVGFQVLTITKVQGKIISDIEKLQLLCTRIELPMTLR